MAISGCLFPSVIAFFIGGFGGAKSGEFIRSGMDVSVFADGLSACEFEMRLDIRHW